MIELVRLIAGGGQEPIESFDPTPENMVHAFRKMDEIEIEWGSDMLGFEQCDYVCVMLFKIPISESLNARVARHPMTIDQAEGLLALSPEAVHWRAKKRADDEAAEIGEIAGKSKTLTDPPSKAL